tara:strand:+ start:46 stop:168 length:123 start_codon:yes stop_codon:yes gene_type:complete
LVKNIFETTEKIGNIKKYSLVASISENKVEFNFQIQSEKV